MDISILIGFSFHRFADRLEHSLSVFDRHLKHSSKVLSITRYSEDSLLLVSELPSCHLQQANKACMLERLHAHQEPLQPLLLCCGRAHQHGHVTPRRCSFLAAHSPSSVDRHQPLTNLCIRSNPSLYILQASELGALHGVHGIFDTGIAWYRDACHWLRYVEWTFEEEGRGGRFKCSEPMCSILSHPNNNANVLVARKLRELINILEVLFRFKLFGGLRLRFGISVN